MILARIDSKLIEWVQDFYLWLWDRTGVFVGTVAFFILAAAAFLTEGTMLGRALMVLFFAVYAVLLIIQQSHGLNTFNTAARDWRQSTSRVVLIAWDGVRLLVALATQDWLAVSYTTLIIVGFLFLPCVQVRDREPPEKRVFAPGGAR